MHFFRQRLYLFSAWAFLYYFCLCQHYHWILRQHWFYAVSNGNKSMQRSNHGQSWMIGKLEHAVVFHPVATAQMSLSEETSHDWLIIKCFDIAMLCSDREISLPANTKFISINICINNWKRLFDKYTWPQHYLPTYLPTYHFCCICKHTWSCLLFRIDQCWIKLINIILIL